MSDEHYMQRCLELAKMGLGKTKTNPMVGCVIVHQDKIIAEGYHTTFGKAHAEVEAFDKVQDKSVLKDCDIYVNLEPCSFIGKTPACASLFEANPCKRLIVGMLDPNPKVAGKGIERVQRVGIEVTLNVLQAACKQINQAFITSIQSQRPYVIAKWAQSEDGFIGRIGERVEISNKLVNTQTQKWRLEYDAYLIGNQTLVTDKPRLDLRDFEGTQPIRCVIGNSIDLDNPFFQVNAPGILFTNQTFEQLPTLFKTKSISNPHEILSYLYQENIGTLVIEGGAITLQNFIDQGLVDELRVITNHTLMLEQGITAPRFQENSFEPKEEIQYRNNSIQYYHRKT